MTARPAPARPATGPHAPRLATALAAFVAFASLVGLLTSIHRREEPLWRIQVVVQDVVDLVLLVPLLLVTAWMAAHGSRRGAFVLGGGLMYALYNLVIYAFALHLNPLFLVYTSALGLAVFALIGLLSNLARHDVKAWFHADAPTRVPGAFLMALALLFLALWLAELVPAALRDEPPASLAGTGLLANPVHALDLSVTLPIIGLSGYWLWTRRPWGFRLAPMVLAFALLTDAAIVAIIVTSHRQGLPADLFVAAVIAVIGLVTLVALVALLRHVDPGGPAAER